MKAHDSILLPPSPSLSRLIIGILTLPTSNPEHDGNHYIPLALDKMLKINEIDTIAIPYDISDEQLNFILP